MTTPTPLPQETSPPATALRLNVKTLISSGAIVPAVLISTIALVAISMVASIVTQAVRNHGLMPRPVALDAYSCKGFSAPFQIVFRHGMDRVQLKSGATTFNGELQNGHIEWAAPAEASSQLGFAAPTAMVYDDTRSLRLLDASGAEQTCQRQAEPA